MHLVTNQLTKQFGGIIALNGVSVEFHPGSITSLVGANGAGKSTLFNIITGLVVPDRGEIMLDDGNKVSLIGLAPYVIARCGIGILFQDVRIFPKLTALENVAIGAQAQIGERPFASLLYPVRTRAREREVIDMAQHYLEFFGLTDKAHLWAEQLSYGQQKLVAIARLLAANAQVLLLDEPTSGVHPDLIDQLLERIQFLADNQARTIILIEHNLDVVTRISDFVYRLEDGYIVAYGSPRDVLSTSVISSSQSTLEGY